MTEAEWLTSRDPEAMFPVVADVFRTDWPHTQKNKRKATFFGTACCRLVWPLIVVDERCRRMVEYLETQFDLALSKPEIDEIEEELYGDIKNAARHPEIETPLHQALAADLVYDVGMDGLTTIRQVLRSLEEWGDPKARAVQISHILRDIVGNPFQTVTFDPSWRTSTVLALAQGVYESRDFSPMPTLADALQDAGCDNAEILDHCRETSANHVRGCWVVDAVLAKQ